MNLKYKQTGMGILVLLVGVAATCMAATYYVRPDGADQALGTENTPTGAFRTIQKAADMVKPGDKVLIETGVYRERVIIRASGTADAPIVFEGAGSAVIDGESNPDMSAENTAVGIRRASCITLGERNVGGSYIRLINLECRNGQININMDGGRHCVIEKCRIHDNYPASGYLFLSGINGDESWVVRDSEIYRCANNGIFLEGGGTVTGCKIYANKSAGIYLRVYKDSPPPVIRDNVLSNNPVAFTTYACDAGQKLAFEHNECVSGGISFANGSITVADNTFRDIRNAVTIQGNYGATEAVIVHNLFLHCAPAISPYEVLSFVSDDNVFSADTIVSRWQSSEMSGGSWMESSLAALGDLQTWQNTSGQDANSVVGNSLDATSRSAALISQWTVTPALCAKGLRWNFKGTIRSRKTAAAMLEFSLTDSTGKTAAERRPVELIEDRETAFDQSVILPATGGEIAGRLDIRDGAGKKLGRRSMRWADPSAMRIEWLHPAYRATLFTEQKDRQLRAKLALNADPADLGALKIHAGIRRAGKTAWEQQTSLPAAAEVHLSFPAEKLPPGSYELVALAMAGKGTILDRVLPRWLGRLLPGTDGKGTVLDTAQAGFQCLAPESNVVRVADEGHLLVDGKPFFPVGVHGNSGEREDLELFSEAGFNVTTGFNADKPFMDAAAKAGIKIVISEMLAHALVNKAQTPEEKKKLFDKAAKIIADFKDHPALLCYLWGEELVWRQELAALYQLTVMLDSYHPVAMNGNFEGATSLYYISDIMMNHLYPYPMYGDSPAVVAAKLENTGNKCSRMIAIADGKNQAGFPGPRLAVGKKPWWIWPQYFHGGNWARGSGYSGYGRFLSLPEMRAHVWSAIARGAKGVMFWAYFHDYTNPRMNPKLWEGVRALGGEIRSLAPMLVQPPFAGAVIPDTVSNLCLMAREYQDAFYLVAVYTGSGDKTIKFALPSSLNVSQLAVYSEKRNVLVESGSFQDAFQPGSVHIYTTAKAQPGVMGKILADPLFTEPPAYKADPGNIAAAQNGAKAATSRAYTWYPHQNYANDSDPDTCWFPLYDGKLCPSWKNPTGSKPEWLEVEFARPETIRRIVVRSYTPKYYPDPSGALSDYDLEAWIADAWQPLRAVTGNQEEVASYDILPVTTKKIRLVAKRGLYLSELEAY